MSEPELKRSTSEQYLLRLREIALAQSGGAGVIGHRARAGTGEASVGPVEQHRRLAAGPVLVVDDDPSILAMLCALLHDEGYRVVGERPDIAAVRRIAREAARLRFLIEELGDASAIESGRLLCERELGDLVELARAACVMHEGSDRHCILEASGPVFGSYDRQRIRFVLEALLDNAVKYSPPGAAVRVFVWQREGAAHIAVEDSGTGILPEDLPRIFGRFARGSDAADHGGLGLGLYVARAIVQAHGGEIAIQSEPFRGTTVTMALPCTPAPARAERGAA